jgi:hypothetical protein
MYRPEDITSYFDVKTLQYLQNKNRGGASGQKFLHWEYLSGLQQGTPPFSIETDEFQRLQERIKQQRPTTFEALEILL